MIKSYKANTNISINVVLPGSKKNLHIAFVPLSDGSSVFSTENEEIQKGMERHYEFGSLFRFVGAADTRKPRNAPAKAQTKEESAPEEAEGTGENGESEEGTTVKVTVTDLASAKDYLADKFGISRTLLRSTKAIMEQAAAHGIEFEGI